MKQSYCRTSYAVSGELDSVEAGYSTYLPGGEAIVSGELDSVEGMWYYLPAPRRGRRGFQENWIVWKNEYSILEIL